MTQKRLQTAGLIEHRLIGRRLRTVLLLALAL